MYEKAISTYRYISKCENITTDSTSINLLLSWVLFQINCNSFSNIVCKSTNSNSERTGCFKCSGTSTICNRSSSRGRNSILSKTSVTLYFNFILHYFHRFDPTTCKSSSSTYYFVRGNSSYFTRIIWITSVYRNIRRIKTTSTNSYILTTFREEIGGDRSNWY